MAAGGGDAGVPPFGGRDEKGWAQVDIYIYLHAAEHCGALHIYSTHYGSMTGYREEASITATKAVVGTGGPDIPREAGGGG